MKSDNLLKIRAVEIEQQGIVMYAFIIDAHTLFSFCTVSRREENKEIGYQRNLTLRRAKSISDYIDGQHGLIPNNFIINFDNSVKYEDGYLVIPRKDNVGWVIDGQHRMYGLHLAKTNLNVIVISFIDLSLEEQVALFIKINSTQKGVPSSLYLDLLEIIGDEESLDRKVRDIVAMLNTEEDSPWYNNINMTGEGKGAISLVNFVRKLRPHLDPERGVLRMYTFQEQYKIVFNFFAGVKAVFLEQWDNSKRLLTKTLGFGALMNAFPDIFQLTGQVHGKFSTNAVVQIFRLISDFQFNTQTLGSGTGSKAETHAGKIILDRITEEIRETQPKTGLIMLDD